MAAPHVLRGVRLGAFIATVMLPWLAACAPPPAKPVAGATSASREELGPLVPLGYVEDRVPRGPGPPRADGEPDFAFRVRLIGPVRALMLSSADVHGDPDWGLCWDTLEGVQPSHFALGKGCNDAKNSWSMAVVDATGTLRNPAGDLPADAAFDGVVLLFVADPPRAWMRGGRVYTLLVERPSGRIERVSATLP